MTRCRPLNRKRKQNPIRCGHDPAGLRSALCRDSVRNGYALSRCVAPRCRKPTHEPPICARSVPKAALARPLPTRQTRQKGRLNFLYPLASCARSRSSAPSAVCNCARNARSSIVASRSPRATTCPSLKLIEANVPCTWARTMTVVDGVTVPTAFRNTGTSRTAIAVVRTTRDTFSSPWPA